MKLKEQMEQIYGNAPPDKIPWNIKQPPGLLVDLVESRKVVPCHAIDLGCGMGNYAIWLATKRFQVTGIDLSEKAIRLVREQVGKEQVDCAFRIGDLTDSAFKADATYAFAYD